MSDVEAAYRHCERITRRRAANFFYGIRLLPASKRNAMCAVYAFARDVDDIGDGLLPDGTKRARLDELSAQLATLGDPGGGGPVMIALADARRRFGLPVDALEDLIEGVRTDLEPVRFETFDELLHYCRLVAGSVGRLCVAIFGSADTTRAPALADDLGVAMQLTNVIRDVREDFDRGRVYLPAEDLERFGCAGFPDADPGAMAALLAFEAERGREWFDRGLALVPLLDRRSSSCVLAMTGIYRRLLDRIAESPEVVMQRRLSLPAWEKAWVAARSLVEAAP